MKRTYTKKSKEHQKIAKERIKTLFAQAKERFKENSKLSDRYVQLARKIAMKYRIKLTSPQKRRFCSHCYKYLKPGANCRIRAQRGKVIYYCLSCKKFTRLPYK